MSISSYKTNDSSGDAIGDTSADISLYIHVPFCTKKCPYCHFFVVLDNELLKDAFLEALQKELISISPHLSGRNLVSVYFGGGTPYLFGYKRVQKLLKAINEYIPTRNSEITLEANPETMNENSLQEYLDVGINRLSIGIQSFNDDELKYLGRTHSAKDAIDAVHTASRVGFANMSIDLMYEIPHQTHSSWNNSLSLTKDLPIHHISLYNLTIEPGTAFYRRHEEIVSSMPNDEEGLKMYQAAQSSLSEKGFEQYEISAFSLPNHISRHNIGYWIGREFLGLGPSAFSFFAEDRFSNVSNLQRYIKAVEAGSSPIDFREQIPQDARRRELLAVGLRVFSGLDISKFESKWGRIDTDTRLEIEKLTSEGLVIQNDERLYLTTLGRRFYDDIASRLI